MDGGVLSVPCDKLDDFYRVYVESVKRGEPIFVVEQKTELYHFFADLDYKDQEPLTLEEIKNICKIICDKVKSLGGKNCLVSIAEPKNVGGLIKTGIHMNWEGFVVNQESALALRHHIISSLELVFPENDWNEIVDVSVYGDSEKKTQGSGFRMPWSHKKGKHEDCFGRGCHTCNNTGKITQSPYLPVFIYNHGPLSMLRSIPQTPDVSIMRMATLRTQSQDAVDVPSPKAKTIKREGDFSKAQTKNELHDCEAIALIETFVRTYLVHQESTRITKIFKHQQAFLVSTTSNFCENLGKAHSSNHVWFWIYKDTKTADVIICQKCFCRCETNRGRFSGFCKDFSGKKHILPSKITQLLYPPGEKKETILTFPTKTTDVKNPQTIAAVQGFLNTYLEGQGDTQITKIIKSGKKFLIESNSTFCEKILQHHEEKVSFMIDKNTIVQTCSCKGDKYKPRIHNLTSSVILFLGM